MEFKRDKYLNEIISKKNNSMIKVITGLRRCGKSYLLFNMYYKYLISIGINDKNIIRFAFDVDDDIDKLDKYFPEEETKIYDKKTRSFKVNSKKFRAYISDLTNETDEFYLLLDEIQNLDNFVGTLNGFIKKNNFDTYVTGSNSRLLSTDIITEFRGRGDQIKIYPLSFREFYSSMNLSFSDAYKTYAYFGGMPLVYNFKTDEQKAKYLKNLFEEVYTKDIVERNGIEDLDSFDRLIDSISSVIGSYTNPTNLENTFKSEMKITYNHITIANHLKYLIDSFLIYEVSRYDIKGKKYLGAQYKYYFSDIGLRNVRLNFRQQEQTHIMENIIYNELLYRGYNVDIGIVETNEKNKNGNNVKKQLEVDFIVNNNDERYYIQSAYSMSTDIKEQQEQKSLININDSFKKMIIVNDNIKSYMTDEGIRIISLEDFLLDNIKI
ncbi:MAG: ATP-binding protein [Acholeplasmatales bacterium]|nr:ATP-binding protein [Acholeplasmatales bacterium]